MAIDCAATGQYLELPAGSGAHFTSTGWTIDFFMRPDVVSGSEQKPWAIWQDIGGNGGFQILVSITSGSKIQGVTYDGGFNIALGATTLVAGTEYYIALQQNGTTLTVFVNGVSDGTASPTTGPQSTSTPLRIGIGDVGDGPFDGVIWDPAAWSAVLTAEELAARTKRIAAARIRPQSLTLYLPLIRNLVEVKGGATVTNNGTTVANHPRMFFGELPIIGQSGAGDTTLSAGVNTITFTAPAATVVPGSVTVQAGVNALTFTAPAATLVPGAVTLGAGLNVITFTAPTAVIAGTLQTLAAGVNNLTFTAPPATIIADAGEDPAILRRAGFGPGGLRSGVVSSPTSRGGIVSPGSTRRAN